MDNLLQTKEVTVTRPVLDTREAYTINGDYVLPDYCPDVAVVLNCRITPRVQSRQWNGDQLLIDGMAWVRILYLDEGRQSVRVAEFEQPISCALRCAEPSGGMRQPVPMQIVCTPDYANARATSPRRLEVRGSFTVRATAEAPTVTEIGVAQPDGDWFVKEESVTAARWVTAAEKPLTVSERLDFDTDRPPAEQLLGGDCRAVVLEWKLLAGKVIVKGQLLIHRLYTDDSSKGTTATLDYVIPFSQILDAEGVQEGQPAYAAVTVTSDSVRCTVGTGGQATVLEVEARLLVQVWVRETADVTLVLDAYHTRYPVVSDAQETVWRSLTASEQQTVTVAKNLELPADDIQDIIDVWSEAGEPETVVRDGKTTVGGRLTVSMLVRRTDGTVAYFERPEEYAIPFAVAGAECRAVVTQTDCRYTATARELELRIGLHTTLLCYDCVRRRALCAVTPQTDQPYPAETAGVKLYYAEAGESVWDIAGACHASPEAIRRENDLRSDPLPERTVLLVPIE